jgi:hypothetical protein
LRASLRDFPRSPRAPRPRGAGCRGCMRIRSVAAVSLCGSPGLLRIVTRPIRRRRASPRKRRSSLPHAARCSLSRARGAACRAPRAGPLPGCALPSSARMKSPRRGRRSLRPGPPRFWSRGQGRASEIRRFLCKIIKHTYPFTRLDLVFVLFFFPFGGRGVMAQRRREPRSPPW